MLISTIFAWLYTTFCVLVIAWFIFMTCTRRGKRLRYRNTFCALLVAVPALVLGSFLFEVIGVEVLSISLELIFLGVMMPAMGFAADMDMDDRWYPNWNRKDKYELPMDPPTKLPQDGRLDHEYP